MTRERDIPEWQAGRQGTETAEGFVPHKRITVGSATFLAPVALRVEPRRDGGIGIACGRDWLPFPRRTATGFIYALPGGHLTT